MLVVKGDSGMRQREFSYEYVKVITKGLRVMLVSVF